MAKAEAKAQADPGHPLNAPSARSWALGPRGRKALVAYTFLVPALVFYLLVVIGPSMASFYFAFTDWSGVGPARFNGLDNFRTMAADPVFWKSLINIAKWMAIFVTVPISLGLVVGAMVARRQRSRLWYSTIFFLPVVVASVVTSRIFASLYNPFNGLNRQLSQMGIGWLQIPDLSNGDAALYLIAVADIWTWWGLVMMIFSGALQQISQELYEAAEIDGAGPIAKFRHITIPSVRPTVVFMVVITIIGSFGVFDYIWVMTQGGPGHASMVLTVWIYDHAFQRFNAGYASALSLVLVLLAGTVIGVFNLIRSRGAEI